MKLRKVLFLSADQWRGECLSILGHPLARTPNLDALASDGVLFARHYAATAPCGPARTSMLIRIGYDLVFDLPAPAPMLLMLSVRPEVFPTLRKQEEFRVEPPKRSAKR